MLGSPVVPFFLLDFGVALLKLNIRKKATPIVTGLLGNLAWIDREVNLLAWGVAQFRASGLKV